MELKKNLDRSKIHQWMLLNLFQITEEVAITSCFLKQDGLFLLDSWRTQSSTIMFKDHRCSFNPNDASVVDLGGGASGHVPLVL